MSILFCKFLHENKVYKKKWSTPRRSQRKILQNCHLIFFYFWNFVTEIFSSQSNVKNHDFIKKSLQFSIFLEHPLVYLIESTKSKAQDWTNKKRPMHFGASLSSGEVLEWKRFYDKSIIGMYLLVLSSHISNFLFWINIFCVWVIFLFMASISVPRRSLV